MSDQLNREALKKAIEVLKQHKPVSRNYLIGIETLLPMWRYWRKSGFTVKRIDDRRILHIYDGNGFIAELYIAPKGRVPFGMIFDMEQFKPKFEIDYNTLRRGQRHV